MFKSAACIISGLGLILSSFFSPAYSATIENGGVIQEDRISPRPEIIHAADLNIICTPQ